MTITENGLTAFDDVVTACRPWYPGHENGSIDVKGFLWHSVETPTIRAHWLAGAPGSNGGLLGTDWMNKSSTESSVHFGTDVSDIVQCGPLDRGCWGCGNGNRIFIQTEQSGNAAMSRADWTSPGAMIQLHNSAKLAAALHRRFPEVPVKWATDQEIRDAYNGGPACGHAYHDDSSRVLGGSSHSDPTPHWPGKPSGPYVEGETDLSGDLFLPLVRQYLAGIVVAGESNPPVTPAPPVIPPIVIPVKDWFDMADRNDLTAALKDVLNDPAVLDNIAKHVTNYHGLVNDSNAKNNSNIGWVLPAIGREVHDTHTQSVWANAALAKLATAVRAAVAVKR